MSTLVDDEARVAAFVARNSSLYSMSAVALNADAAKHGSSFPVSGDHINTYDLTRTINQYGDWEVVGRARK